MSDRVNELTSIRVNERELLFPSCLSSFQKTRGDGEGTCFGCWLLPSGAASVAGKCALAFMSATTIGRTRRRPLRLKALCGPGDQGEPVVTVMMPEED